MWPLHRILGLSSDAAGEPSSILTALSLVSLPILAVSFFHALWRLRRLEGDREGDEAAKASGWNLDKDMPGILWWFLWFGVVFVGILLLPLVGISVPNDILLLIAATAIFCLTGCLGQMSDLKIAHRENTCLLCFIFLDFHWFIGFILLDPLLAPSRFVIHPIWIVLVLVTGAIGSLIPGLLAVTDRQRARAMKIFLFISLAFAAWTVWEVCRPLGTSLEDLAAWVESEEPQLNRPLDWEDLTAVVEFLESSEYDPPRMESHGKKFHEGMAAWIAAEGKKGMVNFAILAAASRLGFMTDEERLFLRQGPTCRLLLEKDGPIGIPEVALTYVTVLVESDTLTLEQHDHLVVRLLAAWQEIDETTRIQEILALCDIADQLGVFEALSFSSDEIHARLTSMWVAPPAPGERRGWIESRDLGGFGDGSEIPETNATTWDTALALELIYRFGLPEGIDLRLVQRYLLEEIRRRSLWRSLDRRRVETILALEKLEASDLIPPDPSLKELLWGERLLLGAVLLAIVALFASWRAPRIE